MEKEAKTRIKHVQAKPKFVYPKNIKPKFKFGQIMWEFEGWCGGCGGGGRREVFSGGFEVCGVKKIKEGRDWWRKKGEKEGLDSHVPPSNSFLFLFFLIHKIHIWIFLFIFLNYKLHTWHPTHLSEVSHVVD